MADPTVTSLHALGCVKIGETAIGGITAQSNPIETTIRKEATSGELAVRLQAIVAQKFAPTFTTMDIARALTACGSLGCLLSTKPLTLYGRARSPDLSALSAGHLSFTYQGGLLIPETLSADHQGDATLSYKAIPIYDGTNAPLVISDANVTIPGITTDSRWTLSSVTLGEVTIGQHVGLNIHFGIDAKSEGAQSDVYDSRTYVESVQPSVDFTSTRIAKLLDILGTSGAISITLRERKTGGTFTGATLVLAGTGLATFTDPFSASGNRRGQQTIRADLAYDGTNAPLGITHNAAPEG